MYILVVPVVSKNSIEVPKGSVSDCDLTHNPVAEMVCAQKSLK